MTEITREGDIKLEVMSTDVEGKQNCKRHNEQLTWKWKESKKKQQIKDWKKAIYMPNQWLLKKLEKKKRKKNQKMWLKKEKKNEKKKENEGQYEHFYFNDFRVWDWCMFFVILFC